MRRRGQDRRRGSAIVETALGLPVVVLLTAGIFQYGYGFHVYHELQSAVRNGGRYAAISDYDSPNGAAFDAAVKNLVVYGKTNPGAVDPVLTPGLTLGNVAVSTTKDGAGIPITVTVSIQDFSVDAVWDTFTFSDKPRTTFRYQGQFR